MTTTSREGETNQSRKKAADTRERALAARERAVASREHATSRMEQLLRERAEALHAREESIASSVKEANEAANYRELLAIVSHDLQNPLNAIEMALQVLLRHHPLDTGSRALVERIRRYTSRMGNMITQLLDFTRSHVDSGMPLQCRPTDMESICRRVIDEMELGNATPSRFVCVFRGALQGVWDPERLAQVVSNLVGNALKHGRPETPIVIKGHGESEHVVLEISNQGEAIPPDLVPFIFDPFRRKRQYEPAPGSGLGLGLYISRQIVLAHGGTIALRSTATDGTAFSLRLPRSLPNRMQH